jgi:hypothetical protein
MSEYTRPTVTAREFRDASGTVIRYGARWTGSPPDDSYSRLSNAERFAPLHRVADALIEHLRSTYRVDVAPLEDSEIPAATRVVAVTPAKDGAAPLIFRFTDFPGVVIRAGLRCRAAFPACGCDACDETWEGAADEMEALVLAVADGTFLEWIDPTGERTATVGYRVRGPDGRGWGRSTLDATPDTGLRDEAARLDGLPDGRWQPWPRRPDAPSPIS